MFLKKRTSHKSMSDVNVYTAKKLSDMAASLSRLAKVCSEDNEISRGLSEEDGQAAFQAAASMVCGSCTRCDLFARDQKEDNYYLYYLLRTFEQKGQVDCEDMPKLFLETCHKKTEYIGQLNRNLGRATMNLGWKNRFFESRDTVIVQFRELAQMLEEFSCQMEQAVDITIWKEEIIRLLFRKHNIIVENMLMLEYANQKREAYITLRMSQGKCMTAREAAQLLGQAVGSRRWTVDRESKSILTEQTATVRFVELGSYQVIHGIARAAKQGESLSGDNYSFINSEQNQVIMSISDGMGSGKLASSESKRVIELTEQLLEAGFSARSALKLVNTVLLLAGSEQHPATLDLCCIDLHSGVLEAMKLGAAATYVIGENGVEILEGGQVPAGVLNAVEPLLLSKKLWDENRIVMVSDGVLDALWGEQKELVLQEYLKSLRGCNPQEMADHILRFACSFDSRGRDDMTVLTAGVWKRK